MTFLHQLFQFVLQPGFCSGARPIFSRLMLLQLCLFPCAPPPCLPPSTAADLVNAGLRGQAAVGTLCGPPLPGGERQGAPLCAAVQRCAAGASILCYALPLTPLHTCHAPCSLASTYWATCCCVSPSHATSPSPPRPPRRQHEVAAGAAFSPENLCL